MAFSKNINKNLVKGSLILLISFGVFNFFNLLFQIIMIRMLSISDYAVLATILGITYILAVFVEAIQTVVIKYSAKENNKGKLKNILNRSLRKTFLVGTGLFVLYVIASIPMSYILDIDFLLLSINGLIVIFTFVQPVTRGFMQSKKRFFSLGTNMVLDSFIKIIASVILIAIGWRVYGAIVGTIIGALVVFVLSFIPLRDIVKSKEKKTKTPHIYEYVRPAFIVNLAIIAFYSVDIIVAKIVFPVEVVGVYAIASIISKSIFWGTQPIGRAMFPMSVQNSSNKTKSRNVILNALGMVLLLLIFSIVAFYFFADLFVYIFSGEVIPGASGILIYTGLAMAFLSITNILLLHRLSSERFERYYLLPLFIIIEIALLFYFSATLLQFSLAFMAASILFLWGYILLSK